MLQINFNNSLCPINRRAFTLTYDFRDIEYGSVIEGIKDYEVYLHKFKGIRYNGSNKDAMLISLFTAESYEELREIAGEDEEASIIVDELEKLKENDEFNALYEEDVVRNKLINTARVEGIEEGVEKGKSEEKINIAKKLLNLNISKEDIMKSTGLSLEEINHLLETI